jgi:hypothetical protein
MWQKQVDRCIAGFYAIFKMTNDKHPNNVLSYIQRTLTVCNPLCAQDMCLNKIKSLCSGNSRAMGGYKASVFTMILKSMGR